MTTTRALLAAAALACPRSAALAQSLVVGARTMVARAPAGWVLQEPHLALDPRRPDRLLVAAMLRPTGLPFPEEQARLTCRLARSDDAGRRWEVQAVPVTACWDPWVAFTLGGEALFASASRHPLADSVGRADGLNFLRSTDGGRRWTEHPLTLRPSPDHPTIAVDTSGSRWRGSVYVVSGGSVQVARSRDGGRSFAPAVRVTSNNLINLAETPAVLSDGALVLSFVDAGWAGDSAGTKAYHYFPRRRAWVVRSADGGETFGSPMFVTDACGQPPHFQQSFLVANPSPAYRDQLYFACRRAGGGPIVVTHSADGGARWSDPVPVSADADDSTVKRVVAMAVSPLGVLAVAWMVGRHAAPCQELWLTASLDGGRSFLRPVRVTAPACTSTSGGTSGDYFGLVSSPFGRFHIVWGEPGEHGGVLAHTTVDVRDAPP